MPRALVLSGGIFHDFPATSAIVAGVVEEHGLAAEVTEDLEGGLARLPEYDLLVVNALRWRMEGEKYDAHRPAHAYSPSLAARAAVRAHLRRGRPLLAVHTAVICFDDWSEWGDLLGAQWRWGQSGHPPFGPVHVDVCTGTHPIVENIQGFDTEDEVYGFLELRPGLRPLVTSAHGGTGHPLVWTWQALGGRVAVDLLGHAPASYAAPGARSLLNRAVGWLVA